MNTPDDKKEFCPSQLFAIYGEARGKIKGTTIFSLTSDVKNLMYGPRLSDGVMVTQSPLKALFMVRIHVGQPANHFSDSQSSLVSICLTRSLSPLVPAERFNQTMRMLMSAGDTPEIRAA
jgi:hypothetical protein